LTIIHSYTILPPWLDSPKEELSMLTSLTRWDPVRDLLALNDRVTRLLGDSPARFPVVDSTGGWFPPVDIVEEGDQIVLRAEIPGVAKDEIEVQVENGTITLRGEKKQEKQVETENAYRVERYYGGFTRSFVLPTSIDSDRIKATYKDGVLEVVLPKAEEAKPRKIKVVSS
jgi:HSP20 family protein